MSGSFARAGRSSPPPRQITTGGGLGGHGIPCRPAAMAGTSLARLSHPTIIKGGNMSINRIEPGPRMSQAVIHGNTVYLAGQIAANPVPSVARQTKQVLGQIDKLLKAAGTSKAKLLTANIWLTDIRGFAEMNEAWDAWVSPRSEEHTSE